MVRNIFHKLKKFLPIIGIFLFLLLLYRLNIVTIIETILSIPPIFILCALPLTIPRVICRNYAWKLIQEEQQIVIPFWASLKIFLIGYFYGSITPGYIGQLMRVPYMKEITNEPYGKLFVNSVIETIVHTMSLYVMIFFGAIIVTGIFPELLLLIIIWLIIFSTILIIFINRKRGEAFFHILIKYLIPHRIKPYLVRFVNSFYQDFPKVRRLLFPLLVGSITWFIIFTQEYFIVLALDLPIPYLYFILLFPVANAVGFIPITFAGLGTRELVAVLIFSTLFHVPEAEVFVVSFIGFIITDIFTGFVGLLTLLYDSWKTGTTYDRSILKEFNSL